MSTSIDSVARSTAPPTTARSGDSGARLTVRPAPATAGVSRHALNLPRILPPKPNPDAPSLDTRSPKGRARRYLPADREAQASGPSPQVSTGPASWRDGLALAHGGHATARGS